jgi:leader peptidase (prepilin peptidase)/N-methyltransferase
LDPVFAVAIFVLGLAFGSFLNVCIHRLPRHLSIVSPGSKCPKCNTPLKLYDNVPLFGWLLLRGRCRHCHASISPRYLVVELLVGALFLLCYAKLGLTLAIGLLFSLLVPVNDLASQLLPRAVFLPVSSDISWHLFSFLDATLGAAVGASFIYGAGAIYMRFRGVEGMGFGDVKLMAMVGAFLGLRLTVLTLFAATLAGSVFGVSTMLVVWAKRTRRRMLRNRESGREARRRAWQSASMVYRYYQMPFGVFLGSMALVSFFFGNHLLRWYWGLV